MTVPTKTMSFESFRYSLNGIFIRSFLNSDFYIRTDDMIWRHKNLSEQDDFDFALCIPFQWKELINKETFNEFKARSLAESMGKMGMCFHEIDGVQCGFLAPLEDKVRLIKEQEFSIIVECVPDMIYPV